MFLEYDITISHSVPTSFLASGNMTAYEVCKISCVYIKKILPAKQNASSFLWIMSEVKHLLSVLACVCIGMCA